MPPGRRLAGLAVALALLIAACGEASPSNEIAPRREASPAVKAVAPPEPAPGGADPPASDRGAPIPDDPGLAGMSPSQRRAYERGYRDCRAGRYDPDRYPEAYRIGCGAAADGQAGGPPKG